jgi:HIRAN domain
MKTLVALVGMKHLGSEALVASLLAGKVVTLKREPTNAYDKNAVQVFARGVHVGYLKANQVAAVAATMDKMGSPELFAKLALQPGGWPMIEIDI